MRKFVSFFGAHTPVFDEVNARAKEYAKERGFDYSWVVQKPYCKEEVIACLKESDVGLINVEPYDASIFSQVHERCKLLVRFGVGFDKVNLKDASQYGICCARTTGTLSDSVAELALRQILACRRQLGSNRAVVESGVWDKVIGNETTHKTVAIVGFGAIGQTLAKLLSGFDCQILAYDPYPNTEKMQQLGVTPCSLEELVERSDAISIHVPYTPQTHHLFHSDRGFQYTNRTFHHKLVQAGMTQSMSRVAHCIDNGPMEGFWGILKRERYYGRRFTSKHVLVQMIQQYIRYYNTRRVQRNLGVLTPMEKHALCLAA